MEWHGLDRRNSSQTIFLRRSLSNKGLRLRAIANYLGLLDFFATLAHFAFFFFGDIIGFGLCLGPVFIAASTARSKRNHASGRSSVSSIVFLDVAMTDLTADTWISANSEIDAERLHAIGVVSFQWNQCEFWLFHLFCGVSELPQQTAWTLIYDLGDVAISTRISVLMQFRGFHPTASTLIKNALEFYDICRRNRNSVIHAWTQGRGKQAVMVRKSKSPDKMEHAPFPCELGDIRALAEEIQWLNRRLSLRGWQYGAADIIAKNTASAVRSLDVSPRAQSKAATPASIICGVTTQSCSDPEGLTSDETACPAESSICVLLC
jgi:hypothetical protein